VANVAYNDRDVAIIQARAAGFVERVYARAPGDVIARGAPIADVLVPEWSALQTEFLALNRIGDQALAAAARQRMALAGMPQALIERVERTGQSHAVITVTTPIGGVIQALDVRAGMTLSMGMTLAKINGLSTVWLEAAIPEAQSAIARVGKPIEARFAAYPGELAKGRVIAVLPETNAESRTVRVRAELDNRGGRYRPGMFAQMRLAADESKPALFVPSEAVIRTGKRSVVIVAEEGNRFQPVEVETGREVDGRTAIVHGLSAGQKVVASGQFLIDSEASLRGVLARLGEGVRSSPPVPGNDAVLHRATGKVEAVSANEITVSHEPVASLGWPAMTMPFALAKPDVAAKVKPGERVAFVFRKDGDRYVVQSVQASGGAK